jgi:hypothetical protein
MSGALLSEVWPDMVQKPKKEKKRRKKEDVVPIMPLTPDEMESELLDDTRYDDIDTRVKLRGMRVSPYTDDEIQYQNTKKTVDLDLNENIERPDERSSIRRRSSYENDPDYQEFLEFKRMKEKKGQKEKKEKKEIAPGNSFSSDEQFNELLLYVFTGFFLLMIYDNMYKLGKDVY